MPWFGERPFRAGFASVRRLHMETKRRKVIGGELAEFLVVIDDQHTQPLASFRRG